MKKFLSALSRCAALLGLATLAACNDRTVSSPLIGSGLAATSQIAEHGGPSRRETPWRVMSDAELTAKVQEAGGRVFIGFKDVTAVEGVDERGRVIASIGARAFAKEQIRGQGLTIDYEFKKIPAIVGRMTPQQVAALRRSPYIEYIEPIVPGAYLSQDTTWNVKRVNAPAAWTSSDGGGAIVLILDSGVPSSHADLSPTYTTGTCDGSNGYDTFGHGSAVAGIVAAANNSSQIIGVSHGVSLWSVRIGASAPDVGAAACGIDIGRDFGVDVITMSFEAGAYTALTDQINGAYYQDDIVVVTAAGNTNGGAVAYPASLGAAIAVSATDSTNTIASFSAIGSKIEIAAPGTTVTNSVGLTSTCYGGSTCATVGGGVMQGTSFAAPHVAAAAAILARTNYLWSAAEIRRRLGAGATDLGSGGRDNYYGFGLLNITGAIAAPLLASIDGPTMYPENYTANFSAVVSAGGPYTYTWRVDGNIQQQGSSSGFSWSASASYTLSLTVVDSYPRTGNASIDVTICPSPLFSC